MVNPSYEDVKAAIVNTKAKVDETITALDNGTDNEVVAEMISDARQLQKDIANNVLDVKRNQASNVLKQARTAVKNNDRESAKESLTDAANRYKEIEQLYADESLSSEGSCAVRQATINEATNQTLIRSFG